MSVPRESLNPSLEMLYDTALALNAMQTIMATPDVQILFDSDDLAAMLRISKGYIESVCDALDPPTAA